MADFELKFDEAADLILHRTKTLEYHSNGMQFQAISADQKEIFKKVYFSVGGGFILDEDQIEEANEEADAIRVDDVIVEDDTQLPC